MSLSFANNGQHVSARVGQQIEISLGTVGPRQYGTPEISSPALQLVSTAQGPRNPGGLWFVYIFQAVAEGEARVTVPVINAEQPPYTNDITFSITVGVGPGMHRVSLTPDQANTAPWQNAWTNLNNFVRQTFTPSRPRLTGVEVELVVANPGPGSAEVSMMVLNEAGVWVAGVFKTVTAADCGHVVFLLPHGGLPVKPGQVYSIALSGGDNLFGWKYVVGGYSRGSAFLNDKPLLKGARSTFLFRTFGAN
ncbi:MAG TPA: hypothetical protein VJN48_12245 [Terriglobales bacterium]|nr:hypothetical protein [Terriglobales bacterium]